MIAFRNSKSKMLRRWNIFLPSLLSGIDSKNLIRCQSDNFEYQWKAIGISCLFNFGNLKKKFMLCIVPGCAVVRDWSGIRCHWNLQECWTWLILFKKKMTRILRESQGIQKQTKDVIPHNQSQWTLFSLTTTLTSFIKSYEWLIYFYKKRSFFRSIDNTEILNSQLWDQVVFHNLLEWGISFTGNKLWVALQLCEFQLLLISADKFITVSSFGCKWKSTIAVTC